MKLMRMFSTANVKGTEGYLDSQKKYEIIRTIIYFGISASLYISGYITTKSNANLLTVAAVLGCLPACKSLVGVIMFLRYKSCDKETSTLIKEHNQGLAGVFDLIFTSTQKTYTVAHITVKGNTICGLSMKSEFPENDFQQHLAGLLKADGFKDVNIKIFTSRDKYLARLDQMRELSTDETHTAGIIETIKNITL